MVLFYVQVKLGIERKMSNRHQPILIHHFLYLYQDNSNKKKTSVTTVMSKALLEKTKYPPDNHHPFQPSQISNTIHVPPKLADKAQSPFWDQVPSQKIVSTQHLETLSQCSRNGHLSLLGSHSARDPQRPRGSIHCPLIFFSPG